MRWRNRARGAAAAALLSFWVLTLAVLAKGRALGLNAALDDPLRRRFAGHQQLLGLARALGSRDALVIGLGVLVAGSLLLRRGRTALVVLIALPAAGALVERVLKPLVSASAPTNSHPGYPSGHAAGSTALATTVLLLLLPPAAVGRRSGGLLRVFSGLLALSLASATAIAVVALDQHNAASAVGGALLAGSVVLCTALGVDAVCERRPEPARRHRRPGARPSGRAGPRSRPGASC